MGKQFGRAGARTAICLAFGAVVLLCRLEPALAAPATPDGSRACAAGITFQNRVLPDIPDSDDETTPSGSVTVILSVESNGAVGGTSVAVSSHNPALDRAALSAAQRSAYAPATYHCKPVASDAVLVYAFAANVSVTLTSPPPREEDLEHPARPHAVESESRAVPRSSSDTTLGACVQSLGRERSLGLSGAVRVATCMLAHQKPATAAEILKKALLPRTLPSATVAAVHPEWSLAYLRLAQAEVLTGQRTAARKHAELALHLNHKLNAPVRIAELPREAARILDPPRT